MSTASPRPTGLRKVWSDMTPRARHLSESCLIILGLIAVATACQPTAEDRVEDAIFYDTTRSRACHHDRFMCSINAVTLSEERNGISLWTEIDPAGTYTGHPDLNSDFALALASRANCLVGGDHEYWVWGPDKSLVQVFDQADLDRYDCSSLDPLR